MVISEVLLQKKGRRKYIKICRREKKESGREFNLHKKQINPPTYKQLQLDAIHFVEQLKLAGYAIDCPLEKFVRVYGYGKEEMFGFIKIRSEYNAKDKIKKYKLKEKKNKNNQL